MDRIKSLWAALDRSERSAFRSYLTSARHGTGGDKQLTLLKLVEKKPDLTQAEASKKLYGDPRSKGFIMMKGRLYDRMVEFLGMVGKSLSDGQKQEAPYARDLIECRRHMLIASLMTDRNLGDLMMHHLRKALALARNCQNPELEVDILLRIRGNHQLAEEDFEELSRQIQEAMEKTSRDAHALGIHHGFYHRHTLQVSATEEMVDYLDQFVPELELRLQQQHSARAEYYFQILQLNRQKLKGDLEAARLAALRAIELLQEYPGIRSRARSSDPYFQLGIVELLGERFGEAVEALGKARSYLKPRSQSYFGATALLTMALIHAGRLDAAQEESAVLEELRGHAGFPQTHSMLGLHTYLQSCLYFLQGDFRAALEAVRSIDDLIADKAGWGTGLRIFELMILVEMDEVDLAEGRLEPLRKHLERYPGNEREKAIYKLIRGQGRRFFSWEDFNGEEKLLAILGETGSWDPAGKEVIRVDKWYREKKSGL